MNERTRLKTCRATVGLLWLMALVTIEAHPAGRVERDLLALQQEWAAARVKGDTTFLERLYAQDFWIIDENGAVIEREAAIAMASSHEMKPESITDEDVKVVANGMTVYVTGRQVIVGTSHGTRVEYAVRFTNIFVRRQKTWKLLAHHVTRIADATAPAAGGTVDAPQ